jgi:hypothetical protein
MTLRWGRVVLGVVAAEVFPIMVLMVVVAGGLLGCGRSKPPPPTVSAELPGLEARVRQTVAGHAAQVAAERSGGTRISQSPEP